MFTILIYIGKRNIRIITATCSEITEMFTVNSSKMINNVLRFEVKKRTHEMNSVL